MTNMSVKVILNFMFKVDTTEMLNMSLINVEYDHKTQEHISLPVLDKKKKSVSNLHIDSISCPYLCYKQEFCHGVYFPNALQNGRACERRLSVG